MTASTYSWDVPKDKDLPPRGVDQLRPGLERASGALQDELAELRCQVEDTASRPRDQIAPLLAVAGVCELFGAFHWAADAAEQAIAVARDCGEAGREADALHALGVVRARLGDTVGAVGLLEEVRDKRAAADDLDAIPAVLNDLTVARSCVMQQFDALAVLDEAFRIGRRTNDALLNGRVLNNAGAIFASAGSYGDAARLYQRAVLLRQRCGDRRGLGQSYNNLGVAHAKAGDLVGAIPFIEMAVVMLADVGDLVSLIVALSNSIVTYEHYYETPARVFRGWFEDAVGLITVYLEAPTGDANVVRMRAALPASVPENGPGDASGWCVIAESAALLSSGMGGGGG